MATTSASIIAAARDSDLRERLVALAAQAGIDNPTHFVDVHLHQLAATQVTEGTTDTVASVYEYAVATYTPTPRPGQNLAAVTDDHLRFAIASVNTPTV